MENDSVIQMVLHYVAEPPSLLVSGATTSTMRPAAVALGRLAAVPALAVPALAIALGTSRATRSHQPVV